MLGRLSLERLFVDLTSAGPARLCNIAVQGGGSRRAMMPTFTSSILKRSETITNKWVASRAGLDAL